MRRIKINNKCVRTFCTLVFLLFFVWSVQAQGGPSDSSVVVDDVLILSKSDLDGIRKINKIYAEKAKEISTDKDQDPRLRVEKLKGLRQEKENSLTQLLGVAKYKLYKEQMSLSKGSRDSIAVLNKRKFADYKQTLDLNSKEAKELENLTQDYRSKKRELSLKSNGNVEKTKAGLSSLRQEYLGKVKVLLAPEKFEVFKKINSQKQ